MIKEIKLKRKIPRKIKESKINNLSLSIVKIYSIYDIILEGSIIDLQKIKDKLELDSKIISKSIFDTYLIVLDTCDEKKDAEKLFEMYKEKLCEI